LGADLFVGSANLTHRAFHANHELTLQASDIPTDIGLALNAFVCGLYPTRLDDETGPELRRLLGARRSDPRPAESGPTAPPWSNLCSDRSMGSVYACSGVIAAAA
jgi:hypothetical protein